MYCCTLLNFSYSFALKYYFVATAVVLFWDIGESIYVSTVLFFFTSDICQP